MKNRLNLTALFIVTLISWNSFANTPTKKNNKCRSLVIASYQSISESIHSDFSTLKFEDLSLTNEEFNALEPERQVAIYNKIKPLSETVKETIDKLNRYIDRYAGTFYELYLLDEIQQWRSNRDQLRECLE